MPAAPLPPDEPERLAALHDYAVLDTAFEVAFDEIVKLAARLTGMPIALISLLDADRQWFKARVGLELAETPRDHAFCGHAILTPGQPLLVADATQDPRFADNPLVTGAPGFRAYAGVPLCTPEGHALGTLCVLDHVPRQLSPEATQTLAALARTVVTTLELRRLTRQVERLALTDALTGLPNRPALQGALRAALARQRRDTKPFSLLYLDLDGMKRVNDVLGHAAGDAALRAVSAQLRGCMRQEDVVARIGGDEFAAVLNGGDGAEAALVAERARLAVKRAMDAQGWPITASIGAVCFLTPPEDGGEALAIADSLMYAAKTGGGNRALCADHHGSRMRPIDVAAA
jgi:diguanylate cyclase (GGDEF)-like protein